MAKDIKAFLKTQRAKEQYRPVCERLKDYGQVAVLRAWDKTQEQSHRCMDCSTPFCHWACPVGNIIPEWNDLVAAGKWDKAYKLLSATNNLPEVTGRICPAPCEYACVLGINDGAITIRENELGIVEHAFSQGLVKAQPPKARSGKKVAVVGSGPAGLSAAAQLNRMGHQVTVFERDDKIGGIMRYGIPDFKLEKNILDRRIKLYEAEGVTFKTNIDVGVNYPGAKLSADFDAVCLAAGSREPRDLAIDGRSLRGIYFAMDYLTQSNKRAAGIKIPAQDEIVAKGKKVVVIGGGDTGSDCVGTANRQGAACVVQIELLPQPPQERPQHQPWPNYPMILKTTTSHEEGSQRHWCVSTKQFTGASGAVKKLVCVRVEMVIGADKRPVFKELPNSEFEIDADLVLLALGFVHPQHKGMVAELGVALDPRGNVQTGITGGREARPYTEYMTSLEGIFACGDMRRGQSLVVWAIAEGWACADAIDAYLKR